MVNTYILKLNGEKRLDYEFNKPEHKIEFNNLQKLSKRKDWELKPLKDCCLKVHRGKGSSIYTIEGIPILKVRNLHNEYIDDNTDFILKEWFDHNKYRIGVKRGDVLLTSTGVGTIGKVDTYDSNEEVAIDGHITLIRVKKEYNPRYILYYLRSKIGNNQIERFTTGCTGQTELNYKHVENFNILIPKDKKVQDEIVNKVENYLNKAKISLGKYKSALIKIRNIINDICSIPKKEFSNYFVVHASKLKDRIDCYYHHPEREFIQKELLKINNKKVDIIKGKDLETVKSLTKQYFEDNKTEMYKYLDIGNTEKDLGDVKNLDEDILLNLPTRARKKVKTYDILQARPIGSVEGVVIVNKELDEQLVSTGFIQIRPKNYEEALILWVALKSEAVQKQMFYLQAGSIQPEITPTNFNEEVTIPIPKGSSRKQILEDVKKDIKEARENLQEYKKNKNNAKRIFLELIGAVK
ncbi:hypothetical protein GOV12_02330 [Candidatus Pacearchaeota archaeon]|nr:hypothetical protein [Candidatus Pacearchaeota archaeon]